MNKCKLKNTYIISIIYLYIYTITYTRFKTGTKLAQSTIPAPIYFNFAHRVFHCITYHYVVPQILSVVVRHSFRVPWISQDRLRDADCDELHALSHGWLLQACSHGWSSLDLELRWGHEAPWKCKSIYGNSKLTSQVESKGIAIPCHDIISRFLSDSGSKQHFYLDLPQFSKSKEAHCLSLATEHWTRKNASRVAIHSIHQTRIENRANSKQTCSRNLLLPRQPNNISHVQNHRLKIIFSNLPSTNKWAWHEAVKTSQHWVEIGEERFKFQTNILGGLWSAHS